MKKSVSKIRGISPVIATVLLVAMVIVIALILFLWFRGITGEACTKTDGKNVELVCGDVSFLADYNSATGELSVSNTGNVPIFGMKVKVSEDGSHKTYDITELSSAWPALGLNQGGTFASEDISSSVSGATSLTVTPILMASCGSKGEKAFVCDESQYGYEITLG